MRRFRLAKGFTLLEVTIALAIMGLVLVVMGFGFIGPLKSERFSGEVKDLGNFLREAQTKSYTIHIGSCPAEPAPRCYWRGNVLHVDTTASSAITVSLLAGSDLSPQSGNLDQKAGITYADPTAVTNITAAARNYTIDTITVGGSPVSSLDLAFLAPDGRAFSCSPPTNCTPSSGNDQPYQKTGKVVITLKDQGGTTLTGIVTFDPISGTLSTSVQ